jgi:integrase
MGHEDKTMTQAIEVLELEKQRRAHGAGGIYPRPNGKFQIAFYDRTGRKIRETYKSFEKAEKMLQRRLAQADADVLEVERRVKVDELAKAYLLYAENSKPKSAYWIKLVWNAHLKDFFGGRMASRVTTDLIAEYIAHRLGEEVQAGTVNRELQVFHAMFKQGAEATPPKVTHIPVFPPKLAENAPRSGFIRDAEYKKLVEACDKHVLRAILAVAYTYGLRKGELLGLRVKQLDFESKTLHLFTGETKSGEGRTVAMTQEVLDLLKACAKDKGPGDYVFTWPSGKPVKDFRGAWRKITKAAGLPELLLHDLRRTAARQLVRAGVDRDTARRITGHKTDSIFSRYNIVAEDDLLEAAKKLEDARKARAL